jgi:hypothetical protein
MNGRKTTKTFESTAEASQYMNTIIKKKQKKGYIFNNTGAPETSSTTASPKKARSKPIITEEIRQWKEKYTEAFGSHPAGRYANKIEWLKQKIHEKPTIQPTDQENTASNSSDKKIDAINSSSEKSPVRNDTRLHIY